LQRKEHSCVVAIQHAGLFCQLICKLLLFTVVVKLSRQCLDGRITLPAQSRVCVCNRSIISLVIPFAYIVVMRHCRADNLNETVLWGESRKLEYSVADGLLNPITAVRN